MIVRYDNEGKIKDSVNNLEGLALIGLWNSFIVDFLLRTKVSANIIFFYIYQLPVPRLQLGDRCFSEVVGLSALLLCYDAEGNLIEAYRELWEEIAENIDKGLSKPDLRAKLDALVAKIYGISAEELKYILSTFPIVEESQKAKVLEEFEKM